MERRTGARAKAEFSRADRAWYDVSNYICGPYSDTRSHNDRSFDPALLNHALVRLLS